jgi:hypothetical protein
MMRVSAERNQLLIFDLCALRWERFNVSRSLCVLKICTLWNLQSSKDLYLSHTVFEEKLFHSFDIKVFGDLHASMWERFNVTLSFAILIELHILESAEFERSFCHMVYCKERPSEF